MPFEEVVYGHLCVYDVLLGYIYLNLTTVYRWATTAGYKPSLFIHLENIFYQWPMTIRCACGILERVDVLERVSLVLSLDHASISDLERQSRLTARLLNVWHGVELPLRQMAKRTRIRHSTLLRPGAPTRYDSTPRCIVLVDSTSFIGR